MSQVEIKNGFAIIIVPIAILVGFAALLGWDLAHKDGCRKIHALKYECGRSAPEPQKLEDCVAMDLKTHKCLTAEEAKKLEAK